MTLKYQLKFYDYWHISSGLSAGAKLDSTVIKDDNGLPYVAGKIIKGLSREMAELLENSDNFIKECFGGEGVDMGRCYFSNATLDDTTAKQIKDNDLQENLYDIIASTKIDEKTGIAVDNSLREIEVVVPLTLVGEVRDISDEYKEKMTQALKMIKRMGLNRNRGLGRCEFIVEEQK
ncbi:MAG: RAMP superfamily CRISPR-associated protein [Sulfurimonas sp.]|nr:RAMP superfamily CRISPR-associated protein [Sulfurimonas sp.]